MFPELDLILSNFEIFMVPHYPSLDLKPGHI